MSRIGHRTSRIIVVVALAIFLIGGWVITKQIRENNVEALIETARREAMAAYQRGAYAESLPHFSYYISNRRHDVTALLSFADARAKVPADNSRHILEAARMYAAAIDLEPANTNAMAKLMFLYERMNHRQEWLNIARRILLHDPENIDALRAKTTGLYLNSILDEAEEYCRKLIAIDPDEVTWRVFLLQIMRDQGASVEQVLDQCDQWIATHKTDGRYHMIQAQLLAAIGQRDRARQAATEAARRGADSPLVLQQLVALLDLFDMRETASQVIADVRHRNPDQHWAHESAIRRLWQHGKVDTALKELEVLAADHDRLGRELLRWKSLLLAIRSDFESSRQTLEELHELTSLQTGPTIESQMMRSTDHAWAAAVRAHAASEASDWQTAISEYRNAIALSPTDPVLHFMLGTTYAYIGEDHLAAKSLQFAAQSDLGWAQAQIAYARALLQLGRYDQAAHIAVDQLQRARRADVDLCIILAKAWLHGGLSDQEVSLAHPDEDDHMTLREFLSRVVDHVPDHPELVTLLIAAQFEAGDEEAAIELVHALISRERIDVPLLAALLHINDAYNLELDAQLVARAGPVPEAASEVALLHARMFHRSNQDDEALALLDEAATGPAEAAQLRARYLIWAGDRRAVDELANVLKHADADPRVISFVLVQRVAWTDQSVIEQAISQLAQVLGETSPRVAMARAKATLRFKSDQPSALAKALLLINGVLKESPESVNAMRLMALLHLAGDTPDVNAAIRVLERAVHHDPRRIELYPQLITLLQHQGDYVTAESYLARLGQLAIRDKNVQHVRLHLLAAQGNHEAIIEYLSQLVMDNESVAERLVLAASLHRAGDASRAEALLVHLLNSPLRNPAVLAAAANFYVDIGRSNHATELLHSYESESSTGTSALLLGSVYERKGRTSEAEKWLLTALERSPERADIWRHVSRHYLLVEDHYRARETAKAGLQLDPDDIALLKAYAIACIHIDDECWPDALLQLERMDCHTDPIVATLRLYDRVTQATRRGGVERSQLDELLMLVEEYPGYAGAWRLGIAAHVQADRIKKAATLAERATVRLPTHAEFAERAAQLHVMLHQLPEALEMGKIWRQRSLHDPLRADAVIAALEIDLHRPREAADRMAQHVERIVQDRETAPDRLSILLQSFAADQRFAQIATLVEPIADEDDRWKTFLLRMAEQVGEDDAKALRSIAKQNQKSPSATHLERDRTSSASQAAQ